MQATGTGISDRQGIGPHCGEANCSTRRDRLIYHVSDCIPLNTAGVGRGISMRSHSPAVHSPALS